VPLPGSAAPLSDRGNTFDAASQISAATYDAMGRLLNDGTKTYNWNLASLLESYTQSGNTISFNYDALGRRISRSETGVARDYVWNDALGLASISVEKESAADLRYYIHTPGGSLLYSIDAVSNTRRFHHFDEMGNTLFLSNDAGAVIGSYAYSPYGTITASTGALDNPFSWQGQYGAVDERNGLYYIRARYYDSTEGRFISRDSIKSIRPKAVNPYQYALNNPLKFVDVTGRTSVFRARLKKYAALVKVRLAQIRHFKAVRDANFGDVGDVIARSLTLQLGTLPDPDNSDTLSDFWDAFRAFGRADQAYNAALEAYNLQKRKAHELHLEEVLDKATEKLKKARAALNTGSITGGGSRTSAQQDKQDKLQQEYDDAKIEFEEAGGIESVIPELQGIVIGA
jgi:RHS repeat-associated protein